MAEYDMILKIENENFAKVIATKGFKRIEFWFNHPKTKDFNTDLAKRFLDLCKEIGVKNAANHIDYEKETYPGLLEIRNCLFIKDEFSREKNKYPLTNNE